MDTQKKTPRITKLLNLVSVIPSSIATCERNFSSLNYIKNKTRNKLGDDYLDDLLLGFLEKDIVNRVCSDNDLMEKVVDKFKEMGSGIDGDNKSRKNFL